MMRLNLVLLLPLLFLLSCGVKTLTPATEIIYQGDIEGNYVSSEEVLAQVLAVKECMGFAERSFPLPQITGLSGGNGVQCGDKVRYGCYIPGMIIVPDQVELDVIAHEAVHHYLFLDAGDMDSAHKSPQFLRCGGSIKTE